ncbi:hypothetical protein Misp06_04013 [Microbulbifer sp. NBRC 101763]|uniref:hypothetical protein n=1 Tax=Microbulbifer sp. NBRC 101763 TaxID=1113820 RepID=UPI0030B76FD0
MNNLEFIDQPLTAVDTSEDEFSHIWTVVSKTEVLLQGKTIGDITVRRYPNGRKNFHACLNINDSSGSTTGLAQGHGDNREEAINNAFFLGREQANAYLKSLEQLSSQINENIAS